ncbi:hypothetical protein [Micromonospora sp. KC721]|uniref:hypothetical protein n=1 Tax=Micromonospora sp. KC721 TaxID=2530380 RepID=UPI00104F36B8|nr:hypothetical protein [Micromonospora sp. KC721]TDB79059.1 hypothetical protein E1182_13995 [Micromonospora sp. KC721]
MDHDESGRDPELSGTPTAVTTSAGLRTWLLIALAFAGARGVTVPGIAAYAALWAVVGAVSQFSMSALGLQFAPPGSASLDTVAVIFMLLPAATVASSMTSRTTELEAVRSRPRVAAQSLWVLLLVAGGTTVAWAMSFLLDQSIDRNSYFSAWFLLLSVVLVVSAISSSMAPSMCALAVVAAFSTPGIVPWRYNMIYNVAETDLAVTVGLLLLAVGACLQILQYTRPFWNRVG